MKKAELIITGDWHLTETVPLCRTDDFISAQWKKVDFVKQMQEDLKCDVFHSGDLYDFWKPSPHLLSETIKHLPAQFYTVWGNHDLPQHSFALRNKSGIYTLAQAGALTALEEGSWNYYTPENNKEGFTLGMWLEKSNRIKQLIGIQHVFIYHGQKPWASCQADSALSFMKKNPGMDLIITGDNHMSFVVTRKNQILVNPGSLTRRTASQIDYEPCVYVYYNNHTVEKVVLPYEKDVISREHLQQTEEKEKRIQAFISSLKDDDLDEISFEDNLELFFEANNVKEPVKQLIYGALEET